MQFDTLPEWLRQAEWDEERGTDKYVLDLTDEELDEADRQYDLWFMPSVNGEWHVECRKKKGGGDVS